LKDQKKVYLSYRYLVVEWRVFEKLNFFVIADWQKKLRIEVTSQALVVCPTKCDGQLV
jgi:hypothetical protein